MIETRRLKNGVIFIQTISHVYTDNNVYWQRLQICNVYSQALVLESLAFRSATLLKMTAAQVLYCEYCKMFKNSFYGPPPMAAFPS